MLQGYHKRVFFFGLWALFFLLGAFIWKVRNSGDLMHGDYYGPSQSDDLNFSVYVGDYLITRNDIEWEYLFYLEEANLGASGTEAIEKLSAQELNEKVKGKKPIVELYNKIMGDLIERKLLFQYIKRDSLFTLDNPERYVSCLSEWQKSIQQRPHFFSPEKSSDRLKSLLCEKDILQQYFKERIEANIQLKDDEMKLFFDKNKADYVEQPRVAIRHILLASENDAKKVRARLNTSNFVSLVKEYSIAPEAASGGIIGPFSKGEMPSLFDVAFEMNVGEIQGIIKSPYGFHIIMLEKKFPKVSASFDSAKRRVRSEMLRQKKDEEYTRWVEMALNAIPIRSSKSL